MPANKTHFGAESFTGMARSHEELTGHLRIISTPANPDPVGDSMSMPVSPPVVGRPFASA
jgi:hypothetical protein